MTTQEVKRKLAAILSADVKGYSRLMGEDEKGTVRTLNAYKEVMAGLIQHHRGRVVDAPGDNVLTEFGSVVDAVECAVEIQKELKTRNAELPENRRMEFRIGVNLGDVIEDGEQILGDGVNIAARLEGLSDPGGICVSGIVYDQVKIKLNLGYEYLGEHTVKNIAEPIRVYRVLMEPGAAGKVIGEKKAEPNQWPRSTVGLVIVLIIIIVAAVVVWKMYTPHVPQQEIASKEKITFAPSERPSATVPTSPAPSVEPGLKEKVTPPLPGKVTKLAPPPAPKIEVASKEKMAFPLPDVPSIAVMPFVNMSEDPKQEFFSDGITENIITLLSKVPRLFVISRQSTFFYKGKPVKVKQVSEELGVQYILEGSVQKSTDRIRINAQLIDALTGRHIWAERYDRNLIDLFAVQDEITMKILRATRVKLSEGEVFSAYSKYFKGKQGFDCYLKLMEAAKYADRHTIEDNTVARRLIEEAISMCPENPLGYAQLSQVYMSDVAFDNTKPDYTWRESKKLADKAIAMDDSIPIARILMSSYYSGRRDYDRAIAEAERAVALDPSGSDAYSTYGTALLWACRLEEAIPILQKAIRLNPNAAAMTFSNLGSALRNAGRFEEAVSAYKKSLQRAPDNLFVHLGLASTYSMMGREQEARAEAAEVLRINPKFSLDFFAKMALTMYKEQSVRENLLSALRKAGLK